MVHALHEAGRVLLPGSLLVDLRPLLDRWPIEVASAGASPEVGRATDLPAPRADDAAAEAAMVEASASGEWLRELGEDFPLFYYWDTPDEMREHIAGDWSDIIAVEQPVWRALRSAWAVAGPEARVRLRTKMRITRFRKVAAGS